MKRDIAIGEGGPMTTPLGFGGSSLMTRGGMAYSLRLLEAAFDAGVRHFDVAPAYGFGEAERCVGRFLARHRHEVTVTTKYGIEPARGSRTVQLGQAAMQKVFSRMPATFGRPAESQAQDPPLDAPLTAIGARTTLERSLRSLGVDRIDLWLLHEATVDRLMDDELLTFMNDSVKRGDVGLFGIGSEPKHAAELWSQRRQFCPAVQTEWSALDDPLQFAGAFQVRHRALSSSFGQLHEALNASPANLARYREDVGMDIGNREVLGRLMLRCALRQVPDGIVLFSSKDVGHIEANVSAAQDSSLDEPAERLRTLVATERESWGLSR